MSIGRNGGSATSDAVRARAALEKVMERLRQQFPELSRVEIQAAVLGNYPKSAEVSTDAAGATTESPGTSAP
jgi:hypothetical protein